MFELLNSWSCVSVPQRQRNTVSILERETPPWEAISPPSLVTAPKSSSSKEMPFQLSPRTQLITDVDIANMFTIFIGKPKPNLAQFVPIKLFFHQRNKENI